MTIVASGAQTTVPEGEWSMRGTVSMRQREKGDDSDLSMHWKLTVERAANGAGTYEQLKDSMFL